MSPDGVFCSVGSYDSYLRIFAYLKWNFVTELPHRSRITEGDGIQIYKEEEFREGEPYGGKDIRITSRYVMCELQWFCSHRRLRRRIQLLHLVFRL